MARGRKRAPPPPRLDREAVLLGVGIGAAALAVGALVVWAAMTAPEGGGSSGVASLANLLTRTLFAPDVRNQIAAGIGGLFMLFGLVAFGLGISVLVRHALALRRHAAMGGDGAP